MPYQLLPFLASVFLFVTAVASHANDSIARVSTGGITLVKNDSIRMIQEVLEISTRTIRVYYQFLNENSQDIQATVAFPMPLYGWDQDGNNPNVNVDPLKSFKLWVDGRLIATQRHQLAVIDGLDVTDRLRRIGLSEAQIFQTVGDCYVNGRINECGLTQAQITVIAQLSGGNNSIVPWQVAETAYWEQLFPAGKEIEIAHEYSPFVGKVYNQFYERGFEHSSDIPAASDENSTEACLDESTRKAIIKRINSQAKKGGAIVVNLHHVEYVLGTGRNWKGPIQDFKLKIEKESPDQIVSLCFPGKPKRTSPAMIEFSHANFVPQDKLIVYFYTVDGQVK